MPRRKVPEIDNDNERAKREALFAVREVLVEHVRYGLRSKRRS